MSHATQYQIDSATTVNVVSSGTPHRCSPTLIFLHFWGGSSRTFTPLISYLSPHFHALAVDFRGWGHSTGPSSPEAYSVKTLALDIETLVPKLGIKEFILVGHSMGGKVAQLIAGRNQVTGLRGAILLAPAPPTPLELPPEMKEQQLTAYSSPESAEFVGRNVLSSSPLSQETVAVLVEDMLKGNEFASRAWPSYGMAEDVLAEARKIAVPILVISGELDRVEPIQRLKEQVLGNIEGADMVVVQGAGHLLPLEAPEQVAGYIEYAVRAVLAQ